MNSIYDFDLIFPQIEVIEDTENQFHNTFEISPLQSGYGVTLGNALRRVALSSLPGSAIKQISIKGVSHEFDVLSTIVEDITSIVLAVKNIALRIDPAYQNEEFVLTLEGNATGSLTAGDIICPMGVEIINKDLHLVTLAEDAPFYMELVAVTGTGYILSDENRGKEKKANVIYVDSIFTPVSLFSYSVTDTRVGDKTNYDKLTIDIHTNGMLTPKEALSYASHIMKEHMYILENIDETIEKSRVFTEFKLVSDFEEEPSKEQTSIETLDVSNRAYNGLKRAKINTIEELCAKSKKEIAALDNIGAKTVDEIEKQLEELGFKFKS